MQHTKHTGCSCTVTSKQDLRLGRSLQLGHRSHVHAYLVRQVFLGRFYPEGLGGGYEEVVLKEFKARGAGVHRATSYKAQAGALHMHARTRVPQPMPFMLLSNDRAVTIQRPCSVHSVASRWNYAL